MNPSAPPPSFSLVCSADAKAQDEAFFTSVMAVIAAKKEEALGPEGKKSEEWVAFIADLDAEAKKASDPAKIRAIAQIRERAEQHKYHDFGGADEDSDDEFGDPKATLIEDLNRVGLVEMRNNAVRGKYDF